ncbi:helix-turn-helix transcriptional regulator [Nocardioides KLBMP 9356]|uniref:Helix-turn-helix transcriptional regulator n=1 Tax=Nocardioides potassii TaxID=2911371 RepID=A0ABS9H8V7_9ACTN|nr:helix-turn-helix domain-containing protein [Nocardioides potassii]MCF6376669.1 helix-turn-helix transcriptional regulator [Nocardioides potassii]
MARSGMADDSCGIARGLDLLGERWTGLVLRDVLRGFERFSDLQRELGVAPDVLSDRLAKLTRAGVVSKVEYREPGHRPRPKYVATESGIRLGLVLAALNDWADEFRPVPTGRPNALRYVEGPTGQAVHLAPVDDAGRVVDDARVELQVLR